MSMIIDWIEQGWSLLQTLGWWSMIGLVFCIAMQCLPLGMYRGINKWGRILLAVAAGALLPMCNFAAIPITIVILRRGAGAGPALAFLGAATLLNPAGGLLAYAYMGLALTVCYVCGAIVLALLVGIVGRYCLELEPPRAEPQRYRFSEALRNTFLDLGPELAFWVFWGVLAEAAWMTFVPASLWQDLLLDPGSASFLECAVMGISRHVCIPDDISLTASLVAAGLRPGGAILFLLLGVCTNLPELFVLWGMAGKKTALFYAAVTILGSIAAALMVELVVGNGFVPQFNLADADQYVALAERFSIRTWMPARIPCAVLLLLLACRGFWLRMKKC